MAEAVDRETSRHIASAATVAQSIELLLRGRGPGLRLFEQRMQAELRTRLEQLRYDLTQRRTSNRIDALGAVLNAVAFCGIACIVLPFYFPDEARFKRFWPLWTTHAAMPVCRRPQSSAVLL
jgi:hypothetical protein